MKKRYRKSNKLSSDTLFFVVALVFFGLVKQYNLKYEALPVNIIYGIAGFFVFMIIFVNIKKIYIKQQKRKQYLNSGILTVDKMKGNEFEKFLLIHFEKMRYKGKITKGSSDYGADIILSKNKETIIVQAKRYSSKVGIKAIQELVAALKYYDADKGIVITNNFFTKNALELAKANNIELCDRKKLTDIMINNGSKDLVEKTMKETIESKDCPECEGKLIFKNGPYGDFYGCNNFPKCKFTRNC